MYIILTNLSKMTKSNSKTTNFIYGAVSLTCIITCNILAESGQHPSIVILFAALSILTLLMTD